MEDDFSLRVCMNDDCLKFVKDIGKHVITMNGGKQGIVDIDFCSQECEDKIREQYDIVDVGDAFDYEIIMCNAMVSAEIKVEKLLKEENNNEQ